MRDEAHRFAISAQRKKNTIKKSKLDLVVAGTKDAVLMVESETLYHE